MFALASPIVHVTPDDPPMFLYHGAWDALVPPSHAIDMKRALDAAGVRSELRIERSVVGRRLPSDCMRPCHSTTFGYQGSALSSFGVAAPKKSK